MVSKMLKTGIFLLVVLLFFGLSLAVIRDIDSVSIDDTPSTVNTGESVTISGSATGSGLTSIIIGYRQEGDSGWQVLKQKDCSGSSCDISGKLSRSQETTMEFQIKAEAGKLSEESNIETVEFQDRVSVSLVSPSNDASNVDLNPTFEVDAENPEYDPYTDPMEDLTFTYMIDKGSMDSNPDYSINTDSTQLSFDLQGEKLQENQDYSWKVQVYDDDTDDDDGTYATSETWTFTTKEISDGDDGTDDGDDGPTSPPVASFTISDTNPDVGETVIFDATGSYDPDGGDIQRFWDFDNDGDYEDSGRTVYKSFSSSGTKEITLKVKDDEGQTTTKSKSITVESGESGDSDQRPVADFSISDTNPDRYQSVNFDGASSYDPDGGSIRSYSWDLDDDGFYEKSGKSVYKSFSSTGTKYVTLKVRDDEGDTDTKTRSLTVGSDTGDKNDGKITVRVEDRNGNNLDAKVRVSGPEFRTRYTGGDGEIVFSNLEIGYYDVRVSKSGYDSSTRSVNLRNDRTQSRTFTLRKDGATGDNLDARFTYSPTNPEEGETVNFDASNSRGDIKNYRWSFGNNWFGSGVTETHTYLNEGSYQARLTVENFNGNTDTTTKTVNVQRGTGKCRTGVSSLRLDPDQIFEDESSEVSLQVANDADQSQRLSKVKIYSRYDTYLEKSATVDSNSEKTFKTDVSPDQDTFIQAEVVTKGDPCGKQTFQPGNKELTVFQSAGDGGDGDADLEVHVEDEDGDDLEDARVEIENGHRDVEYTDGDGDAQFNGIEADTYDVEVSKSGYDDEEDTVELEEGDDRTVNFELERDEDNAELKVLVEDDDGDRLEDAEVEVENSETETEFTDDDGRADFFLDPDTYDVTVSKDGYDTEQEEVELDAGEDETLLFELDRDDDDFDDKDLEITHVDYPSSVCRGESFTADVTVKNNEYVSKMVTLTGSGLGSVDVDESFSLDDDELKIQELVFTDVEGSGTEEFTITAENHDIDSVTKNIQVENCDISDVPDGDAATGLTMDVTPTETVINKPVQVKGYVRGVSGRSRVNIEVNGVRKASVTTQPDGYYQAYITPTSPGRQTITARTGNARASQEINVVPTASVLSVDTPQKVFEGEKFEICADIESEVSPKLYLLKNDKVVKSQYGSGEVCFTRTADGTGTHRYTVKALTYGKESSSSTSVEVLKSDSEVESFPDKVASVESEESMVKVRLYNTHEEPRRYQVRLSGLPSTWTSQTDKEVILPKGGEDTVYFYLTPREEGTYKPTIEVESDSASIFQQEVTLESGGTKNPREKSFLESVFSLFGL